MDWRPGQQLQNGKYTIERILGVGGFGITYLARKRNARRDEEWVVIKTLKDEVRHRPDLANRQTRLQQDFLNEALKLAQCKHPHVVQVKELIREEIPGGVIDGIVMEYIQGESLEKYLSRQGILPETEALRYIRQVGAALTVVHDRDLLHRDVKPANIMIRSGTSEAVLIDFGLAREFMQDLTQTHSIALTHGFAPLEQYDRQGKRGTYTDVYALAATLYCSLTKHIPHPAYLRLSGTALESPRQLNLGISDRVNEAILKGLELRADDRPQSMQEWLGLLEESIVRPIAPVQTVPQQLVNATPQIRSVVAQQQTPIVQPEISTTNAPKPSANSTPQTLRNVAQNRTSITRSRRSGTIPWGSTLIATLGYLIAGFFLSGFLENSSSDLSSSSDSAYYLAWIGIVSIAWARAILGNRFEAVVVGTIAGTVMGFGTVAGTGVWAGFGPVAGMMIFGAVGAGTVAMAMAEAGIWVGLCVMFGAWAVASTVAEFGTVAGVGKAWSSGSEFEAVAEATVPAMAVATAIAGTVAGVGKKLLDSFNSFYTFLVLMGTSLAGLGLGWLIGTVWRLLFAPQTVGML